MPDDDYDSFDDDEIELTQANVSVQSAPGRSTVIQAKKREESLDSFDDDLPDTPSPPSVDSFDDDIPDTPSPAKSTTPTPDVQVTQSGVTPVSKKTPTDDEYERAVTALHTHFGHKEFRPHQWEIVQNALNGRNQLVLMSTGYGKSVCYQLPSLIRTDLTIVVSPLISLMEDQISNLRSDNIDASTLNGQTSPDEKDEIKSAIHARTLRFLYLTPEYVDVAQSFLSSIKHLVGLIAIDEAHCVSQWGHDFRSSYRKLAQIRSVLPGVPVMALTATAAPSVRKDIVDSLGIPDARIICTGFDRKNLVLSVFPSSDVSKDLPPLMDEDDRLGRHFGGPTIIYCPTRSAVDEVNGFLKGRGVRCEKYHAGMSESARRKTHHSFIRDQITTVVATVAFGMGIDKPDVRVVIHYGAPRNVESYYQEIGRAGRDGQPAKCIVFFSQKDLVMNRGLANRSELREPYRSHSMQMLAQMEKFLTTLSCRRQQLAAPSGAGKAGKRADVTVQVGEQARMLLQVVAEVYFDRKGINGCIDFVRGMAKEQSRVKPTNQHLFGAGKAKNDAWWKAMAAQLRIEGMWEQQSIPNMQFGMVAMVSTAGRQWLMSGSKDLRVGATPVLLSSTAASNTVMSSGSGGTSGVVKILGTVKKRTYKFANEYPSLCNATAENAELVVKFKELRAALDNLRGDFSSEQNIGPFQVAPNSVLDQLSSMRPDNVSGLSAISDWSAAKVERFGKAFVDCIADFCDANGLPTNCSASPMIPPELETMVLELRHAARVTYEMHVTSGVGLKDLSHVRSISESTACAYLAEALALGLPVHRESLGLTEQRTRALLAVIKENKYDVSRMKPLMEALPEGAMDYNVLKMLLRILEHEYGISIDEGDGGAKGMTEDTETTTTTEGKKPGKRVPAWMMTAVATKRAK